MTSTAGFTLHIADAVGAEHTRAFHARTVVIGRDPSADLTLPDPERVVSRRHAEIQEADGGHQIVDLGSKNTTVVDGRVLTAHVPFALVDGACIGLGPFVLRYERADGGGSGRARSYAEMLTQAGDVATLHDAVHELAWLSDLLAEVGALDDYDAAAACLARRLREGIGAEQVAITLLRAESPLETLVRAGGVDAFHADDALLAWMERQEGAIRIDDPQGAPPFVATWPSGVRQALCAPLRAEGRYVGVLTAYNSRNGRFTERDERLLDIVAAQSAHLVERKRLTQLATAHAALRQELELARDIQGRLLPRKLPDVDGYELAAHSRPATSVGGDLYEIAPLGDGRVVVAIGDVSGKGLSAALVMANVLATLRALAGGSPEEVLARANDLIHAQTARSTFVTLLYGLLDPATHTFTFANAGHVRPIIARAQRSDVPASSGLVLGVRPGNVYDTQRVTLGPGDVLLLTSDGVDEAMNARRETLGAEAVRALAERHRAAGAAGLVTSVERAVDSWTDGVEPHDDITQVALRRAP